MDYLKKIFPYANEGESYYCRKCKRPWVIGKTEFDKSKMRRKICPGCRVIVGKSPKKPLETYVQHSVSGSV